MVGRLSLKQVGINKNMKNKELVIICRQCGKKYRWSGYHDCISCRVKNSFMSGNVRYVRKVVR